MICILLKQLTQNATIAELKEAGLDANYAEPNKELYEDYKSKGY